MTPNEIREKVEQIGDPTQLLCVKVLDCWMDDYVRDDDWLIGVDERENMAHDVKVFWQQLGQIAFASDFRSSKGGKF